MNAKKTSSFDLEVFLAGNGGGANRKYKAHDIIFAQGDPCDGVFYVQEGKCKMTVVSERGKEAVVALHDDSAAIRRVIHEQTEFSEFFIARLLAQSARVEADLVDQLFNSSEKRLARQLLLLANFAKDGKSELIEVKISQGTLAEMIGTTRSRVSFFMNKFRKLGLIDYNGDIHVHNALLNVVLHDSPAIRAATEDD